MSKWMAVATAEIGQKEAPGAANNPRVVEYLASANGTELGDVTPWCAGFVGWCLKKAGYPNSGSLMARSYLDYGVPIAKPRYGCIAVFARGQPPSGHVGFWTGDDNHNDLILGGNQSDAVSAAPQGKAKLLGYRWPIVCTIRDLQALLKGAGHYAGTVDGDYGPKTKAAVIAFKRSIDWHDRTDEADDDLVRALRTSPSGIPRQPPPEPTITAKDVQRTGGKAVALIGAVIVAVAAFLARCNGGTP